MNGLTLKQQGKLQGQIESHSISSLAVRLLCSRATVRNLLSTRALKPIAVTENRLGGSFILPTATLDAVQERALKSVEKSLRRLNLSEQQRVTARVQVLRQLEADSKTEEL